jgi:hypothetical protein
MIIEETGTLYGSVPISVATTEEFCLKISSEDMFTHWVMNIQMTRVQQQTLHRPPQIDGIVFLPW